MSDQLQEIIDDFSEEIKDIMSSSEKRAVMDVDLNSKFLSGCNKDEFHSTTAKVSYLEI